MKIRLYENLRTVSYAPFYIAEGRGLFAAEGLDVDTIPSPAPEETALGLIEGCIRHFGEQIDMTMENLSDNSNTQVRFTLSRLRIEED